MNYTILALYVLRTKELFVFLHLSHLEVVYSYAESVCRLFVVSGCLSRNILTFGIFGEQYISKGEVI